MMQMQGFSALQTLCCMALIQTVNMHGCLRLIQMVGLPNPVLPILNGKKPYSWQLTKFSHHCPSDYLSQEIQGIDLGTSCMQNLCLTTELKPFPLYLIAHRTRHCQLLFMTAPQGLWLSPHRSAENLKPRLLGTDLANLTHAKHGLLYWAMIPPHVFLP